VTRLDGRHGGAIGCVTGLDRNGVPPALGAQIAWDVRLFWCPVQVYENLSKPGVVRLTKEQMVTGREGAE